MTKTLGFLALVASVILPPPTIAGIADSPIPAPFTQHLYSVPGVINDAGSSLATYFLCTSTSTAPQTVGLEVFPAAGGGPVNNAATTAQTVAPGATVAFGTSGLTFVDLGANLNLGVFPKGSGRILSTSKSLICTAFIADASAGTPPSMTSLTITKKTKQKGD